MKQPLLTIIVPTHNRADCLALLLDELLQELGGLEDRVHVIIGDNASSDATPAVAAAFAARYGRSEVLRHSQNVGPDENFCRCLDSVASRFFWIIGDDDLPKRGLVAQVLGVLERSDPDLLYFGSEWLPNLADARQCPPVRDLKPLRVSSGEFAGYVNVWVTFISGMVVNRQRLMALQPQFDSRGFSGTSLVQLGWVLGLLMAGSRFFVVTDRCILATSGNSGGYKLITVFATNFPAIVDRVCGPESAQRRGIVRGLAWNYVPTLLWMTRFGAPARFSTEDVRGSLAPLRGSAAYRLVMTPILDLPKPLAAIFWLFSRLCGKAIRAFYECKLAAVGTPASRNAVEDAVDAR